MARTSKQPGNADPGMGDHVFAFVQRLLPTRLLSSLMHAVAGIRWPPFKNLLISVFLRAYRIDLDEARLEDPRAYASFNDFFTRALKPGARPLDSDPAALLSPVDGRISQYGEIHDDLLIQAKGHSYSLMALLAGDREQAARYVGGQFCTIYLAPYNYHRIHMPASGRLVQWTHVPGRLFSVNAATASALPGLFARNERLNAFFDGDRGPFALVMVGALFVGSLQTVWAGLVSPPHRRGLPQAHRPESGAMLESGEEMGRFNMGSTVILLLPRGAVQWDYALATGRVVRQGQRLGLWTRAATRSAVSTGFSGGMSGGKSAAR